MVPSRDRHTPPASILGLANTSIRIVESRWLGQNRTANNESAKFGDRYNYILSGRYTIGSASSDYITNTHTPYFPHPQDKLVDIEIAVPDMSQRLPVVSVTVTPGWRDQPYGHFYEPLTDKPSHLATHPGNVQFENVLLCTNALNPTEQLDGFNRTIFDNLATNIILPWNHLSAVVINGIVQPLNLNSSAPFNIPLAMTDSVTLWVASTCISIRLIHADGAGGQDPVLNLKGDEHGLVHYLFTITPHRLCYILCYSPLHPHTLNEHHHQNQLHHNYLHHHHHHHHHIL